jgi:hypothetical protein
MARKPLTERHERLKAAYKALAIEKAQLRTVRARVAAQKRKVDAAQRVIDAMGVCDGCGDRIFPTGAELQLCHACGLIRREEQRVALLAAHGYDARGRRKVGPALSA